MAFTVFYDGYCPLCVAEMQKLHDWDKHEQLNLVDIQRPDFSRRYPELERSALNARLHGYTEEGELLKGLEVTYEAWRRVGRGGWIAPLRWPVIKWLADGCYLMFARHRYLVSRLITGKARCDRCAGPDLSRLH